MYRFSKTLNLPGFNLSVNRTIFQQAKLLLVFFFTLLISIPAYSQPGETCESAIAISGLPYYALDFTDNYNNDYSLDDFPPNAPSVYGDINDSHYYFGGNDVVYTYTPDSNQTIDIELRHLGNIGVYVFTGCPFTLTQALTSHNQGISSYDITQFPVIADSTYYIVIALNHYFEPNPYYELNIRVRGTWDCPDQQTDYGSGCNDDDPNTVDDIIRTGCICAGDQIISGQFCDNPIEVDTLPYLTSDNILAYGNHLYFWDLPDEAPDSNATGNYSSGSMNGGQVVYKYTPDTNQYIDLLVDPGYMESIFVLTGCPYETTIGYHTVDNHWDTLAVNNLYVEAGTDYYILLGTGYHYSQVDYSFSIREHGVPDCPVWDLNIGESCDDNDPTTFNDILSMDCSCAGTPAFPGQLCAAPLTIDTLPYTTSDNTYSYGNNYDQADFPPIATDAIINSQLPNPAYPFYTDEVIYAYTPDSDQLINLSLTNPLIYSNIYVVTGCPFDSTLGLSNGQNSTDDLTIPALHVTAGTTYYIIVICTGIDDHTYTLHVETANWDCYEQQLDFGDSCDDGNADTENDVITDSCTCAGTPIDYDCANSYKYPNFDIIPDPLGDETPLGICTHYGDYTQITNVYTGNQYAFAGSENNSDELVFITVRHDSVNGPVLGTGISPLIVSTISDADLFVHWNTDSECGTATEEQYYCLNTSMLCLSCPAIIDCEENQNGEALQGTPCDDGNPTTVRDTWNGNCTCIGETPIPGNICESAIPLECNGESNTYSTPNGVEFYQSDCFPGINGLWFTFTGNGGEITLNMTSTFNADMAIFTGDCNSPEMLTCLTFYEFGSPYQIVNTLPGQDYYIYLVEGWYNTITSGEVTISIDCELSFNGSVTYNSNCNNKAATLLFYQPGTDSLVGSYSTFVDSDGNFEIANPPVGNYDIFLDVSGYLNVGIGTIEVTGGLNFLDFGSLRPGDINGDNTINLIDVSYLNLSFGKSAGDLFYDIRADINCNGIVDLLDVSSINAFYSQAGDEAPLESE